MTTSKLSMIAIALAVVGTSFTAASAETPWQYNHPRRVEVNERLGTQNFRIQQGVADGRITPYQAAQLHAEDHTVRTEERAMVSFDGGHITRYDQRLLNQQENGVSNQIGH